MALSKEDLKDIATVVATVLNAPPPQPKPGDEFASLHAMRKGGPPHDVKVLRMLTTVTHAPSMAPIAEEPIDLTVDFTRDPKGSIVDIGFSLESSIAFLNALFDKECADEIAEAAERGGPEHELFITKKRDKWLRQHLWNDVRKHVMSAFIGRTLDDVASVIRPMPAKAAE